MSHRILIVEDDKHFASQLKELFDYHGLDTRVAVTGPEGIEAFRTGPADFLLVDVMLPEVHGIKVLETIRTLPGGADVPALLMSAVYKKESLFKPDMQRLGVHGFLPKPFSLLDIGRKVNGILLEPESGRLGVRSLLAEAAPQAAPPPPNTASASQVPRHSPTSRPTPLGAAAAPQSQAEESTVYRDRLDRARYAGLLTHLFHSHASGILRLGEDRTVILYLLNGYPVWAETSTSADLLDWLIGEGVASRDQVQHLFGISSAPALRAALLDGGVIDTYDMPPLMEAWVSWNVRRVFGSEVKGYSFEKTDEFAGMVPVYEVNPIRELWQAAREVPVPDLESAFAEMEDREVGRTRSFNRLFGYVATTDELRALGEFLLPGRKLEEVRGRFQSPDATRCLWLLLSAGLVAVADAPASSQQRERSRRRTPPQPPRPAPKPRPRPSASHRPRREIDEIVHPPAAQTRPHRAVTAARPTPTQGQGADGNPESRIALDYVTRMEMDYYAFLGLERDATPAQVDARYEDLAPRYRLRNLGTELHPDTRRQAKELLTKLVEAFGELSDPRRRARYDRSLAEAEAKGRRPPGSRGRGEHTTTSSGDGPLTGYPSGDSDRTVAEATNLHGAGLIQKWQQARRAMHGSEWRRALGTLENLRVDLPSEPGVLADMAWCCLNAGIPTESRTQDRSLEWVALAEAFQPGHPDVIEVKARILAFSEDHAAAVRALKRLGRSRTDLAWIAEHLQKHEAQAEAASESKGLSGLFGRRKR